MQEYKIFVKKIGLVGVSSILASLSPLVLLPILSQDLTASQYGAWNQFIVTMTIIPAIASLGLPYTMVRYLAAAEDQEEIREVFYSLGFAALFGSLAVSILILLLGRPIANLLFEGNYLISAILSMVIFLNGLILLFFDYFRTFQEMKTYSIFTFAQAYLMVILVAIFISMRYGIVGAVIAVLITQIITFVVMYLPILSRIGFKIPEFRNLREYLNFGLPTIPSNISFWVLDIADRYVIGLLLGLSFVGYYSAGYLLGNIISLILSPFYTVLLPILSKYYAQNRVHDVKRLLNHSIKFFLMVSIPTFFGLTVLAKPILNILSTPEIASNGYIVVPIIALGGIFFGVYGIISQIVVLEHKTRITGNIWIISAVLNLVLDVTLGFRFGIVGVAFTTLLVYIFSFLLTVFYSFRYIRCTFYFGFLTKSIGASILMAIALILLNPQRPLNIVLASFAAFIIYIITLRLIGGIRDHELVFFKSVALDVLESIAKPFKKL